MESSRAFNKSHSILSSLFVPLSPLEDSNNNHSTADGEPLSIRDRTLEEQSFPSNRSSVSGTLLATASKPNASDTATPPAVDILYDLLNRALNNLLFDQSTSDSLPTSTVTTTSQVDSPELPLDKQSPSNYTSVNKAILNLFHLTNATMPPPRVESPPEILILDELSNTSVENTTSLIFRSGDSSSDNLTALWPSMSPTTALMPNTTDDTTGLTLERVCFASPEDYDLIPSVLCSSLFVLGVVFCTFGGRCCRAFAFFLAAVLSAALAYLALNNLTEFRPLPPELIPAELGIVLLACLIGLVLGAFTSLVNPLAAVTVGVHFGALIGVVVLSVIFAARPWFPELQGPIPPGMGTIFAVVLTLVGAIATVNMPRGCTIVTSSCYGAALSVLCVDYFVEKFAILYWYRDHLNIDSGWSSIFGTLPQTPIIGDVSSTIPVFCPGSQILLIVWACLTIFGVIVQSCCTCRGMKPFQKERSYEHVATTPSTMLLTPGSADITSTSRDKGKSVEDLRLEQKHRKYRYLYQVRTAHGDVLSQQYFQNIQNQKKLCFPSDHTDTCTFNSDMSSHFLPESRTTTLSVA